jgi:hypothetical protein
VREVDRFTLLLRAAAAAYEIAWHYTLDDIATELLYLREKISDLFHDFFFGSGRRAKREYAWVRERVEQLYQQLLEELARRGDLVAPMDRNRLVYHYEKIREGVARG